ncbi:hypothetical protein D3C86_1618650 [compost metagenome]
MTDSYVEALNVKTFLVDDSVNRDSRFTSLTVTDDQLTLATTDWYQGVDSFDTSLKRFFNWMTVNDTRSLCFNNTRVRRNNSATSVDRVTKSVYYAS